MDLSYRLYTYFLPDELIVSFENPSKFEQLDGIAISDLLVVQLNYKEKLFRFV